MKRKKLNICLLLATKFKPESPSRPSITELYGKYLPSKGHKITWITSSSEKCLKKEKYNEVDIYPVYHQNSSSLVGKSYQLFKYYINRHKMVNKLFKENNYDIIQTRNDVFDGLIALNIRRKYKIPFVFQYSFPQEAYKFVESKNRYTLLFGKITYWLLKQVTKNADFIFPISEYMAENLNDHGLSSLKMMPIPMGINSDLFHPMTGKHIKKMYKLNNFKVLLYIGSMDSLRQLEIVINAFSKILSKRKDVFLLMVGEGNDLSHLKKLSYSLKIENNILFTGKVPYFKVPEFIAASDICISPIPPLPIYKISSPTKLFEYMAVGKPFVANKGIYEQDKVVNESKAGLLVDFDSDSFTKGLLELLDDPAKADEMGKNGNKWVRKNRDYKSMVPKIEEVYYKLMS